MSSPNPSPSSSYIRPILIAKKKDPAHLSTSVWLCRARRRRTAHGAAPPPPGSAPLGYRDVPGGDTVLRASPRGPSQAALPGLLRAQDLATWAKLRRRTPALSGALPPSWPRSALPIRRRRRQPQRAKEGRAKGQLAAIAGASGVRNTLLCSRVFVPTF
jgi:hypothetical protein